MKIYFQRRVQKSHVGVLHKSLSIIPFSTEKKNIQSFSHSGRVTESRNKPLIESENYQELEVRQKRKEIPILVVFCNLSNKPYCDT